MPITTTNTSTFFVSCKLECDAKFGIKSIKSANLKLPLQALEVFEVTSSDRQAFISVKECIKRSVCI